MHFTVRAARCAATGSRGKRHEQGGAHDVGWSALHTATGRLIRHISSSLPPITLPSNAHRRAYYPLMRSRGQLNSVLSEPGRCVRTCAIDRDRSSIPRLTSSSRDFDGAQAVLEYLDCTRCTRTLPPVLPVPPRLCSLHAPLVTGRGVIGGGLSGRRACIAAPCTLPHWRAPRGRGRKPRKAKARDTLCP